MRFSEETLMAYADGELNADTRAAVDMAMQSDTDLADAIALQIENRQALIANLHAAFDSALEEEVPARLINAAGTESIANTECPLYFEQNMGSLLGSIAMERDRCKCAPRCADRSLRA